MAVARKAALYLRTVHQKLSELGKVSSLHAPTLVPNLARQAKIGACTRLTILAAVKVIAMSSSYLTLVGQGHLRRRLRSNYQIRLVAEGQKH